MIPKNNRQNTDFQILYFLIGSCHTVDAAYGLLHELRDDRIMAIKTAEAKEYEQKAELLKAKKMAESEDEIERLKGISLLLEHESHKDIQAKNFQAAKRELEFIEECLRRIEPHRKFSQYPDHIAFELAQRDEWRLEFINRAENALMTSGTIPMDEFNSMRMHPDFQTSILPEIVAIKKCIETGQIDRRLTPPEGSSKKILLDFLREKEQALGFQKDHRTNQIASPIFTGPSTTTPLEN